jgi:hypothetical protein
MFAQSIPISNRGDSPYFAHRRQMYAKSSEVPQARRSRSLTD